MKQNLKTEIAGLQSAALFLLAVLFSGWFSAQVSAAVIDISGTVEPRTTLNGKSGALAIELNFGSANLSEGVQDLTVAVIVECSNNTKGYTVTMSSQNGGTGSIPKMRGVATGEGLPYSLKYDGVPVVFNGGLALLTNANQKTPKEGVSKSISLTITKGFPAADTYTDMLTVSIANK